MRTIEAYNKFQQGEREIRQKKGIAHKEAKKRLGKWKIYSVGKEKFNLLTIPGYNLASKVLSMDEYLKFVQFNLEHGFDMKFYRKLKRKMAVNERFVIK
ncbi:MAG: hypothetical protein Q7K71_02990 [Candidatus Omnitrophota bacterium]|nr:hypothetical protein [Candidatus Omnitrophota bacterium]